MDMTMELTMTEITTTLRPAVFHILLALSREPRHGLGIAQAVDDATEGAVVLGPGTLYRSLKEMLRDGLVEEAAAPSPDDDPASTVLRVDRSGSNRRAAGSHPHGAHRRRRAARTGCCRRRPDASRTGTTRGRVSAIYALLLRALPAPTSGTSRNSRSGCSRDSGYLRGRRGGRVRGVEPGAAVTSGRSAWRERRDPLDPRGRRRGSRRRG